MNFVADERRHLESGGLKNFFHGVEEGHKTAVAGAGPLLLLVADFQADNRGALYEIDKIIRDKDAAISKELEGNPSANEKISDKKEEE